MQFPLQCRKSGRQTVGFRALVLLAAIPVAACRDTPSSPLESAIGVSAKSEGFVASVENAPVVPDGVVAGAVTDFVINLDVSMDPGVPGRELGAGRTIKVVLPDAFTNTGAPALADVFSSASCFPGNLQCTTAVLLQGWPQHPLLPRVPPAPPGTGAVQYSLSLDGPNTIIYTAVTDLVAGTPLPGPGIKQLHLILNGFRNPERPGFYPIQVMAETGPDGSVEVGTAYVHIIPNTRPHIGVTSAFNLGAPNTIFQAAESGDSPPLDYDFLLWNRNGDPFVGVTIEQVSDARGLLRQGRRTIGQVLLVGPPGASGMTIDEVPTSSSPDGSSVAISSPVTGVPAGHLRARFTVGDAPGAYTATFELNGGSSVTMHVEAS